MPPKNYRKNYKKKPRSKRNLRAMIVKTIRSTAQTKRYMEVYNSTAISTTTTDTDLVSSITKGNDIDNREGNILYVTGLYGQYYMTTADATQVMRMVLYIPKRSDTSLSGQTQGQVTSFIDPTNFTVLLDKMITLNTYRPLHKGKIAYKFKGKGLKIRYDPDTDIIQGTRLRLAFVSDSSVASHPTLNLNLMVYFKDY